MSENSEEIIMVGVDVAKDKLDIAFANEKVLTIKNEASAFKKLVIVGMVTVGKIIAVL